MHLSRYKVAVEIYGGSNTLGFVWGDLVGDALRSFQRHNKIAHVYV
jgi:hypothetical protein